MSASRSSWSVGVALWAVSAAMLWSPSAAGATSHREAFETIFGKQVRDVKETRSLVDDARFANQLLRHVESLEDAPGFQMYLLTRVYEYGRLHRVGFVAAVDALDRMAELKPARRAQFMDMKLQLYQREFRYLPREKQEQYNDRMIEMMMQVARQWARQGDWTEAARVYGLALRQLLVAESAYESELRRKLAHASQMDKVQRRAEIFRKRLKRDPEDRSAAKVLARTLLRDLDQPKKVVRLLKLVDDEAMSNYVPLAAKHPMEVPDDRLLPLAHWYEQLARKARGQAEANMLMRSWLYYTEVDRRHLDGALAKRAAEGKARLTKRLDRHELADSDITGQLDEYLADPPRPRRDQPQPTQLASIDVSEQEGADSDPVVDDSSSSSDTSTPVVDDEEDLEPEEVLEEDADEQTDIPANWKPREVSDQPHERGPNESIFDF